MPDKFDEKPRCHWCGTDPLYVAYHDEEWGRAELDPRALFECLMLEAFQAGLSWITILRKRDGFRAAFAGFDPDVLALWGPDDVARALQDPGIVRHRGKIEAVIAGAKAWQRIEAAGGFSPFIWRFVNGKTLQTQRVGGDIPAQSDEAVALSKALKREGFKFTGPTITYAFMQAVGMVNDHVTTCHCHGICAG